MKSLSIRDIVTNQESRSDSKTAKITLNDVRIATVWVRVCCYHSCELWCILLLACFFMNIYLKTQRAVNEGNLNPWPLLYVYSTKSQQQAPYNVRWRRYNDTRQCDASATLWAELCPQGEKSLLVDTKLLWLITYDETFPCWQSFFQGVHTVWWGIELLQQRFPVHRLWSTSRSQLVWVDHMTVFLF